MSRGERDVVGGKCRAELYLILIMTRLVPMSLSAYRHAAKGFISCNLHSHSPPLYHYPNPLPHKQTDIPKKRIDARRCGHPPTGEETLSSPTSQYDPVVQKHVLFTETKLK